MTYVAANDSSDGVSKVIYQSKDGTSKKTFDALDWPALLNRVNNVDPLLCPKCSGSMRIISLIDDAEIIKKILKHLALWEVGRKPPARANSPPPESFIIYDESSAPSADDYLIDADRSTLRLSTGYPIDLSRRSSTCWVVAESEA